MLGERAKPQAAGEANGERRMVAIEALRKRFGDFTAVDGVSLEVRQGETVALLGPSGSGKTTILRCIAGLESADEGTIVIGGRTVDDGRRRVAPSARRVGMVFQNFALWPHMTVLDNVAFVAKRQGGLSRKDALVRARELLASVELDGLGDRRPGEMSGGQQQRVAVARALASGPALLLMDEPLSALDTRLREALRLEVRRQIRDSGLSCLYVTHDQEEALAVADRIAVMWESRIIEAGDPLEIYTRPRTLEGARFFGCSNTVVGAVVSASGKGHEARVGEHVVPFRVCGGWEPRQGDSVEIVFRPASTSSRREGAAAQVLAGPVLSSAFTGTGWESLIAAPDGGKCLVHGRDALAVGDSESVFVASADLYGYPRRVTSGSVAADTPRPSRGESA